VHSKCFPGSIPAISEAFQDLTIKERRTGFGKTAQGKSRKGKRSGWLNPLCPKARKRTIHAPEVAIGNSGSIVVCEATDAQREEIYRARHAVYAGELRQHQENSDARLTDALDSFNVYLTARIEGQLAGFLSITPPCHGRYSIDKYFLRENLPFSLDNGLFEVRLLTVLPRWRGLSLAFLLMYASLRWIDAHGGTRIVAIGRREVLDLYRKSGFETLGMRALSGEVVYELMTAEVSGLRVRAGDLERLIARLETRVDWRLPMAFRSPAGCFHGGAFFEAVGDDFEHLDRSAEVINADVLDAWFPPSPRVLRALQEHLPWLVRTSPPTASEGLARAIAAARRVPLECIVPGAGSSDLIFLALRHWLNRGSRVLLLDPTYGEYAHVLENLIGCRVVRLELQREDGYVLNPEKLAKQLALKPDFAVLVNPNSPTGQHVPRSVLEGVLARAPQCTRIWVDETYVEYAGADQSLERFAAGSENVVVCKSMSKVYALSGLRAAYLCAPRVLAAELRVLTPPWAVSLPAQVAGVAALADPDYYSARYSETHILRERFAARLLEIAPMEIFPSVGNFLLCHLPDGAPLAHEIVERCRRENLFIRDAVRMGRHLGSRALRIAVKDGPTNQRMLDILSRALKGETAAGSADHPQALGVAAGVLPRQSHR